MIVSNKHPVIAREGWSYLAIVLLILVVNLIFFQPLLFVLEVALLGLLIMIFRDPARQIPASPLGIVSPVDGKIVAVKSEQNAFNQETFTRITIKVAPLGVFAIRSPIEGKMVKQWYEESGGCHQYWNWVQTDEADDILWTSRINRPSQTQCYVQPGERVGQGQRCGFLPFGYQIDVWVPKNSSVNIKEGSNVRAGESILAFIVRQQSTAPISDAETTLLAGNVS